MLEFHHIGIACEDIEKQEPLIRQLIGTAIREGFLKDENVH